MPAAPAGKRNVSPLSEMNMSCGQIHTNNGA
jgi:hypothetical protein